MFKYINMPRLVAYYLREFSNHQDPNNSAPFSNLYVFVMCCCLPFFSQTFRTARLNALAIAECTCSQKQVERLLMKLVPNIETVSITKSVEEFLLAFGTLSDAVIAYDDLTSPLIVYTPAINDSKVIITLKGSLSQAAVLETKAQILGYLPLLIPFFIKYDLSFND